MQRYSVGWWARVLEEWNASGEAGHLANLGIASFKVLNSPLPTVVIHWDKRGTGTILPADSFTPLCFAATAANWQAFIDGEFGAAMGVLTRRIRLEGNPVAVLPYTAAFNRLAKVSRRI